MATLSGGEYGTRPKHVAPIIGDAEAMLIVFATDETVNYAGWSASYETSAPRYGRTLPPSFTPTSAPSSPSPTGPRQPFGSRCRRSYNDAPYSRSERRGLVSDGALASDSARQYLPIRSLRLLIHPFRL